MDGNLIEVHQKRNLWQSQTKSGALKDQTFIKDKYTGGNSRFPNEANELKKLIYSKRKSLVSAGYTHRKGRKEIKTFRNKTTLNSTTHLQNIKSESRSRRDNEFTKMSDACKTQSSFVSKSRKRFRDSVNLNNSEVTYVK